MNIYISVFRRSLPIFIDALIRSMNIMWPSHSQIFLEDIDGITSKPEWIKLIQKHNLVSQVCYLVKPIVRCEIWRSNILIIRPFKVEQDLLKNKNIYKIDLLNNNQQVARHSGAYVLTQPYYESNVDKIYFYQLSPMITYNPRYIIMSNFNCLNKWWLNGRILDINPFLYQEYENIYIENPELNFIWQ